MMIVKANEESEAGGMPSRELIESMGRFNAEMVKAGVLLAAEGLHPSSRGARVGIRGGKPVVTDGPFPETRELIAGFWLIRTNSLQEAIDWASRCPTEGPDSDGEIEIRQVFEQCDFSTDTLTPEEAARENELAREMARQAANR